VTDEEVVVTLQQALLVVAGVAHKHGRTFTIQPGVIDVSEGDSSIMLLLGERWSVPRHQESGPMVIPRAAEG